jgi:zinc protease
VFVFVGDVDIDEVFGLAATYLGTLPSSGVGEEPIDVAPPPPAGVVEVSVEAGSGDTATVSLLFTSPVGDITPQLRATTKVATELMTARLTDVIREELGESYSPFAFSQIVTDPDPVIETFVGVTGSPDRVASIADLVVGEIAGLATDGPSVPEFDNAVAQAEEAYGFINNGQILTELLDDAVDPYRELDDYLFEFSRLPSVSPDSVRSFVAEHLTADRYVQVTVVPR